VESPWRAVSRPLNAHETSFARQNTDLDVGPELSLTALGGELSLAQSLVSGDDFWRWVSVPDMSGVDIAPMLPWCSHGVSALLPTGVDQALRFNRCRIRDEVERVALVLRSTPLAAGVPDQPRQRFAQQRQRAEQRGMLRREGRRELLALAHRLSARAAVVGDTDHVRWWTREFVAALRVAPRLNELETEERWLRRCLLLCDSTAPTAELREWVEKRQQFEHMVQKEKELAFIGPWLAIGSDEQTVLGHLKRYLDATKRDASIAS
jgi:hypothetical protein